MPQNPAYAYSDSSDSSSSDSLSSSDSGSGSDSSSNSSSDSQSSSDSSSESSSDSSSESSSDSGSSSSDSSSDSSSSSESSSCSLPETDQAYTNLAKTNCECCPCCSKEEDNKTTYPVRYGDGEVILTESDLEGGGNGIPWAHRRTYGNLLSRNDVGVNGNSWLVESLSYVTSSGTRLCVVISPERSVWFEPAAGGGYAPMFGTHASLTVSTTGEATYFDEESGSTYNYSSIYSTTPASRGILLSFTTAGGTTMMISRDTAWRVTKAQTTGDVPTTYEYAYGTNGKFSSVTQYVGETPVRRVEYLYHSGYTPWGSAGDLSLATISEWQDGVWAILRRTAYRYHVNYLTGGFPHALRTVLSPTGWDRMVADGLDPLTATIEEVEAYALSVFAYDSQRRVTSETVMGGQGTYHFTYATSSFPDGPNTWATKTTVTNPDGSIEVVYANIGRQVLLKIQADSASSSANQSMTATTLDENYHVVFSATSMAVASVSESTPQPFVLKDNEGLIKETTWYASSEGEKAGHPKGEYVRRGTSATNGTRALIRETDYTVRTTSAGSITLPSTVTEFPVAGGTGVTKTTSYAFFAGTLQPSMITTTAPTVPSSQNGDGVSYSSQQAFDSQGRPTWSKDALGVISVSEYDPVTGALVRQIQDVDTSVVSGAPSGWSTLEGNGRNLVTDIANDLLGRPVLQLMPLSESIVSGAERIVRQAVLTERLVAIREDRQWNGYVEGEGASAIFTPLSNVTSTYRDANGAATRTITAKLPETGTSYGPLPIPQDRWIKRTDYFIDRHDQVVATRLYHNVPASGDGLNGPDFSQLDTGYDSMGRQTWTRTGGGTIIRKTYDYRGLTLSEATGTGLADGSTDNLVTTVEYEYDGNGQVITESRPVDTGSTPRVVSYVRDWRGRVAITLAGESYAESASYDNLNRVTRKDRTDGMEGTLLSRIDSAYDDQGRLYRTTFWKVEGGVASDPVDGDIWYDALSRQVKVRSMAQKSWQRTQYDSLGRTVATYYGYPIDGVLSGSVGSVTGDYVVNQTLRTYRDDGAPRRQTSFERLPGASGIGPLGWPTGTATPARASVVGIWADPLGRPLAVADFGTNGGIDFALPITIPTRSDTVLVTSYFRNPAGDVVASTDPSGIVTRIEFDAVARQVKRIEAWTGAAPSGGSDRTTEMAYNLDGNLSLFVLKNSVTGDQVYRWNYGTTLADSGIASTLLLREHVMPDSAQALDPSAPALPGNILYTYNIQGQAKTMIDQAGTTHAYAYDALSRLVSDNVVTLGTSIDGAVRTINTGYDKLGRVNAVTSLDQYGSIVNQSLFEYDGYGRMTADVQQSGGAGTSSSPRVQYGYADGSTGTLRRTSMTLPSGTIIAYTYGYPSSPDDMLGRVASVTLPDESLTAVAYSYLGASTVVKRSMEQPGLVMDMTGFVGDAGDNVGGLDRFGRVESMPWSVGTTAIDNFQYGYTPSSFRRFKKNAAGPSGQDEAYGHDLLQQVTSRDKGTLNVSGSGIAGTPSETEQFNYDPAGNWLQYVRQETGETTVNQTRAHDKANTLIKIDGLSAKVAHDAVGNMTKFPISYSATEIPTTAIWDAWNRMVQNLVSGEITRTYEYDGLFRRLRTSDTLFFWSDTWQLIEKTPDDSSLPRFEYIRGTIGIGEVIIVQEIR